MASTGEVQTELPAPEALETPLREPKPKGLVKRSGFIWAGVALLGFLLIMFLRDVMSTDTPVGGQQIAGPAGSASNPASAANYAQPQLAELDELAARAKASAEAARVVQPNLPDARGPETPYAGSPIPAGRAPGAPQAGSPVLRGSIPSDDLDPARTEQEGRSDSAPMLSLDTDPELNKGGAAQPSAATQRAQGMPELTDINAAGQAAAAQSDRMQENLLKALGAGNRPGSLAVGHRTEADRAFLTNARSGAQPSGPGPSADGSYAIAAVQHPQKLPEQNPVLLKGTRIPVVSLEAINSDMPGTLSARVTSDVFDSLTQSRVLLPRGARLDLVYSSEIRPGQTRILLATNRVVRPDGLIVDLSGSQGADSLGRSGLEGAVNNHFLKMFGYSLATALIAAKAPNDGLTSSTTGNGQTSTSTVAGQVLSEISQRIMQRNSDIPPTITLPVGVKFHVVINRDVALPVYQMGR